MTFNISLLPLRLQNGVAALASYGFIQSDASGIPVTAVIDNQIIIKKESQAFVIHYDTEPHFYMALARSIGMPDGTQHIEPKAKNLGLMLDCSRNAVPKPDMIKQLICILVLAGYNYLELYTEETYELPDEPYFGYRRGRYTAEELREIKAFAGLFHFEMIPCIQTLAHLSNLGVWMDYLDYMDTKDTLLVGDERTYKLIRKSIRFFKEIFQTERINIGTDEAFQLGRGKYTERYGYKPKNLIYLEHLKRVFEICHEEGVKPEFWADAIYMPESSEEEIRAIFDGDQLPIYWSYDPIEKETHCKKIRKAQKYAGNVMFCGALWKCIGHIPDNSYSMRALSTSLEAALECHVDNILMSAWGDNGNECSIYSVIPSMWYAAGLLYPCQTDIDLILVALTGYTNREWITGDKLNYLKPNCNKLSNAAKWTLYNDFLIGMADFHITDDAGDRYQNQLSELEVLAQRGSRFSYIFQVYSMLCKVLIRKATYGKRLYKAYHQRDFDLIRSMTEELQEIKKDLHDFYEAFRTLWLTENKETGLEVMDVRIGGLIARADTVSLLLKDYLNGRLKKIYALEEPRLEMRFWEDLKGDNIYAPLIGDWSTLYTMNHI